MRTKDYDKLELCAIVSKFCSFITSYLGNPGLIFFARGLPELREFPSGLEGLSSGLSYLILRHGLKTKAFAANPEKTRPRLHLHVLGFLLLLAGIIIATGVPADYLKDPFQAVVDAILPGFLMAIICGLSSFPPIAFAITTLFGTGIIYEIVLDAGADSSQGACYSLIAGLMISLVTAGLIYVGSKMTEWVQHDRNGAVT